MAVNVLALSELECQCGVRELEVESCDNAVEDLFGRWILVVG